ncbi:MAG TPA: hypothetical protein EYP59_13345 [Thiotrichaceae bacterium]|nr:hypothetical protein [Thiotrichaceae bacterium]
MFEVQLPPSASPLRITTLPLPAGFSKTYPPLVHSNLATSVVPVGHSSLGPSADTDVLKPNKAAIERLATIP